MSKNQLTPDEIEYLKDCISRFKHNKKFCIDVAKTILEENKKCEYVDDHMGLHIHFSCLSQETYNKLAKLVKKVKSTDKMSEDYEGCEPYTYDDLSQHDLGSKLRYSNHERNLLRRQHYQRFVDGNKYEKFNVSALTETEENPKKTKSGKKKKGKKTIVKAMV
jgi:hypothetical protein